MKLLKLSVSIDLYYYFESIMVTKEINDLVILNSVCSMYVIVLKLTK